MGRPRSPKPRKPTFTYYVGADGKRCKKSDPGATKRTETSDTYHVRLTTATDDGGRRRTWHTLGTTDIGQAWRNLRGLLERLEKEAAGVKDPTLLHAARPIEEHVADWLAQLRAGGRTGEGQLALLGSRVRKLVALAGWERLPQIDRDGALKALHRLGREKARGMAAGAEGRGAQTRNHYARHLKQFVGWCVEEGRLLRSPVQGIDPLNVERDRRHPRRSPTDEEVGTLMAYLDGSGPEPPPVRCRMTGPQRGLGYRLSMATGFRAKELRLLTRQSFDLDRGAVAVAAAYSKNGKTDVQPLPAWLVAELREWFDAGGGLWGGFPRNWPGRLLLADQEACGIAHRTEEGYWDFHALRVYYCTFVGNSPGVSPKTLQTLARHADPRLTLKVYTRAQESEGRKVIDAMPRPGGRADPGAPAGG